MLALSGCASVERLDAAGDVHALLLAIRDNDQAKFDAHVDRAALKQELKVQVMRQAVKRDRTGLAAMFAPALADFAGDALIQPQAFRLVAEQYGYRPDMAIPGPIAISTQLRELPDGRICAVTKKKGPCQLVFTKEGGDWKLTSFEGDASLLKLER
jgi:hypothetical protein